MMPPLPFGSLPAGSAINVIGLRGDIKDALGLLRGEYVQRNLHRMGALGAQDVALAVTSLQDALRKLPNDRAERPPPNKWQQT